MSCLHGEWNEEDCDICRLQTELADAKERLAEIEKAAALPYDDLQVISSIGNDGSIEYVAAYAELRTHALHLSAENARLDKALEECEHQTHSMRVWNGADWHYHPPQAARIAAIVKAARKGKA